MPRAFTSVLLLALVLTSIEAAQNLHKTTCPLCNMDVKANINATILGNQYVYACEMAGHIDSLQDNPGANLGLPKKADIRTDKIYKDATNIKCPVCGKGYDQLTHTVPWISKGAQKIYTCSEEHARLIYDNPSKYVEAQTSSRRFCDAGTAASPTGSAMFNGFHLATDGDIPCLLLLFQPWILSSAAKYVIAFLGVVLLAMSLEGFGELRALAETRLFQIYGIVSSQTDYVLSVTPQSYSNQITSGNSFAQKVGRVPDTSQLIVVRRLPLWCKVVLAGMYMVHLSLGYFVMLVIMTFETLMFVAVILGVGLGFFIFKDTDANEIRGSVDPCCST
ncbi:hypothetical protein PsorP6_004859 [Peronosclerospora sorghi]|uniref:Uncharacterized protein n=1 Tax=Peronosclerospora sorghi TaxID=230839 RepID=A0ACC0W4H2_9STRA|nr:hypothetical protein PsorP6_004859 [Peronosclerospora sorghi]